MKRKKRSLWKQAEETSVFNYSSFQVTTKKNNVYNFWKGKLLLPPYIKDPSSFYHHYRVAWYDAVAAVKVKSAQMRLYRSTCFACQTHCYARSNGSCGTIIKILNIITYIENKR